jgi:hypothetical protein
MMEAESASETSLTFYQTKRHNNEEKNRLHFRNNESLKSQRGYSDWLARQC